MSLALGEQRKCDGDGCDERIVGAARATSPGVDEDLSKIAPITALPKENGNILLWRDADDGEPRYAIVGNVRTVEYLRALGVPLRLNHFADCAAKKRFERRTR